MGVSTYRRIGVCKALSTFVLVLGAFLLLGACTSTDSAKKMIQFSLATLAVETVAVAR